MFIYTSKATLTHSIVSIKDTNAEMQNVKTCVPQGIMGNHKIGAEMKVERAESQASAGAERGARNCKLRETAKRELM